MLNNYLKVVVDGVVRATFFFDDTEPEELEAALDKAGYLDSQLILYRLPEYEHPRLARIRISTGCGSHPHVHDPDPKSKTGGLLPCVRCHARAVPASKRRAA